MKRSLFIPALLLFLPTFAWCQPDNALFGQKDTRPEKIGNLTFYRNPSEALKMAKQSNRPLFIDFYADWCVNCKKFNKLAVADRALNRALGQAILLKVYDRDPAFGKYQKEEFFKELKIGLPLFVVLTPQGNPHWKTINYRDSAGMIAALKEAL